MVKQLKGAPVAAALQETIKKRVSRLQQAGVIPTLAIVRVGAKPDDIAYETGAKKQCAALDIAVKSFLLAETATQQDLLAVIDTINTDSTIHGCLLLRPLPAHLDEPAICAALNPEKDVDGITASSLSGVFANLPLGFSPCTAQAVMEMLHGYSIDCNGKKAVVIGRSMVIGKPVAMLLLHENATVTICHTKTADMAEIVRAADLVVVAAGKPESFDSTYFRAGQIVVDVGMGWHPQKKKLCGDVCFDEVNPIVAAITPVPGGVGSVTTSVLAAHVVTAAERIIRRTPSGIGQTPYKSHQL